MSAKFCSSCGAALRLGAAFCSSCGATTQPGTEAPAAAPTESARPALSHFPMPGPPEAAPVPPPGAPPPATYATAPAPSSSTVTAPRKPPLLLIVLGVIALIAAGWVILSSDYFGNRSRSTPSNLESFLVGSWGRDGSCGQTITFESGGRVLATGEDPGTWSLRQEGAGLHILRVEIDGERAQGWVERRGDQLDIFQSQGSSLAGRYSRCGSPSASAGSGAPASPPTAPVVPADRQNAWGWLIGRWGQAGDCSRVISLNEDGTMRTNNGQPGTWSASGTFGTYPLTMTAGGRTVRATAVARGANEMQLIPVDGSAAMQLNRCG